MFIHACIYVIHKQIAQNASSLLLLLTLWQWRNPSAHINIYKFHLIQNLNFKSSKKKKKKDL